MEDRPTVLRAGAELRVSTVVSRDESATTKMTTRSRTGTTEEARHALYRDFDTHCSRRAVSTRHTLATRCGILARYVFSRCHCTERVCCVDARRLSLMTTCQPGSESAYTNEGERETESKKRMGGQREREREAEEGEVRDTKSEREKITLRPPNI